MAARWFTWSGVLIIVVGAIDLIWTQVSIPTLGGNDAFSRWQVATGGIFVIGLGVLIIVAAQILDAISRRPSAN